MFHIIQPMQKEKSLDRMDYSPLTVWPTKETERKATKMFQPTESLDEEIIFLWGHKYALTRSIVNARNGKRVERAFVKKISD